MGYSEEENTWKPTSALQYFYRLFSTFHKKHLWKPIAMLSPLNLALPTGRLIIKPKAQNNKQKHRQPIKAESTNKCFRKNRVFCLPP